MTTGYVDEDDARLEHSKWVAELEQKQAAAEESEADKETVDTAKQV